MDVEINEQDALNLFSSILGDKMDAFEAFQEGLTNGEAPLGEGHKKLYLAKVETSDDTKLGSLDGYILDLVTEEMRPVFQVRNINKASTTQYFLFSTLSFFANEGEATASGWSCNIKQ